MEPVSKQDAADHPLAGKDGKDGERADLKGQVLDDEYEVGACIGMGGTGVVFEGQRISDGLPVAIKMLRPRYAERPELQRRLLREAEVAELVDHPSIVPVYGQGMLEDGSPYLAVQRINGESLSHFVMRTGKLSVEQSVAITIRVASILHRIHQLGIIHRDIKPEHLLLEKTEDGYLHLRLLDFGVCLVPTASPHELKKEIGRVYGTPGFASPEQAAGEAGVGPRADLFSLGVVLFQLLTGKLPFRAPTVAATLRRTMTEDAPRVALIEPTLDPALDRIVAHALARRPEDRFENTRVFARALAPFALHRLTIETELADMIEEGHRLGDLKATQPDMAPLHTIAA